MLTNGGETRLPAMRQPRPDLWRQQPGTADGLFDLVQRETADGPALFVCRDLYAHEAELILHRVCAYERLLAALKDAVAVADREQGWAGVPYESLGAERGIWAERRQRWAAVVADAERV